MVMRDSVGLTCSMEIAVPVVLSAAKDLAALVSPRVVLMIANAAVL